MSLEHLDSMMFGRFIRLFKRVWRGDSTDSVRRPQRSASAPILLAKLGSDEVLGRRPSDSPLLLQMGADCIERPVNIDRDVHAETERRWWLPEPTFMEPNKTGGPFEFLRRAENRILHPQ